ncbi:MAG: TatD family hydrolase [Candidatus Promineifilaceae bacterium]
MLIDTHCHLDFDRFDEDREAVLERAIAVGVERIIVPALDLKNCPTVLALADQYEQVYAAVGVHPNSSAEWQDDWLEQIQQFARHEKVVAIGEIGLDYYWDDSPKEVQQRALARQLELAEELGLPVIIHNRNSDEDVLRLLAESPLKDRPQPGVLHSFSAPWETAESALEMGYFLGFTGPVTYKNANELRAVVAKVPLNRILVETDAPFLAPQQHRGKRNEPAYVAYVAERIAQIRGLTEAAIAWQTTENARRLFGEDLA